MENFSVKTGFKKLLLIVTLFLALFLGVFGLTAFSASAETEENDLWETANNFNVGTSVSGALAEELDVDFYKFNVRSQGKLTLSFDHTDMASADSYWTVTIYNESKSLLDRQEVTGSGTSMQVLDVSLYAGNYYISVAKADYYSNTKYTLNTKFVYDVVSNQIYYGNVSLVSTEEYSFNYYTPGYIEISAWSSASGLSLSTKYWILTVYDMNGNIVYTQDISGDTNRQVSPRIGVDAGSYTIKVKQGSTLAKTEFALLVKKVDDYYWEKESNETISTATQIKPNASYNGSVMTINDQDYYVLNLEKDGVLEVNFKHEYFNDTARRWNLTVMDDKSSILYSADLTGQQDNYFAPKIGLPVGAYYIRVRCYAYNSINKAGNTMPYQVTARFTASTVWEKEFNEDISTATPMNLNTLYNGGISSFDDQDYYTITTTRDGMLEVNFQHEYLNSTSRLWNITVMDIRSTVLFSGDLTGQQDEYFIPQLGLPSGTYYVRIRCYAYNSINEAGNTMPYQVTASFTASTVWEKEFNEDISTATPMNLNTTYNGSLRNSDDVDYYRVTTIRDGVLDVTFTGEYINSTSNYYEIDLVDKRSNFITGWILSGQLDYFEFPRIGLGAGEYYLVVYVYKYLNTMPYTLTADFTATTAWEKELNTDVSTATPIDMYTPYHGTIANSNSISVDYYKVENPYTDDLTVTFEHYESSSTSYYYSVALLDERQNVLKSANVTLKNNPVVLTVEDAAAGVYYVKVAYYKNLCTEPYTIVVANPHECYGYFKTVNPAGCLTSGLKQKHCSVCGVLMEEQYVPAHGHYFTAYTSTGMEQHTRFCSACDLVETCDHEWNEGTVTVQPTCLTTGTKVISCKQCSETMTEIVSMLSAHVYGDVEKCDKDTHQQTCVCGYIKYTAHTWDDGEIIEPPTHLTLGKVLYTCQDCGETKQENSAKTTAHEYGEYLPYDDEQHARLCACGYAEYVAHTLIGEITVEATCLADGVKTVKCSVCEYGTTRAVAALGHNYEKEFTVDKQPTCEEDGVRSYHCSRCGEKDNETVIEKLSHSFGEWRVSKNAVCDVAGEEVRECERCKKQETRVIVALAHVYETEWTVDTFAACETEGSKSHHCTLCGHKGDVTELAALGHEFGEWQVDLDPNCTKEGKIHRVCERCKKTETHTLAKLGHNYEEEWTIDTYATCEKDGVKSHHCNRCGEKNDETAVEKLGHSFGEWTVSKNAVCGVSGKEARECERCKKQEARETAPLNHAYETEWTVDTFATCVTKGSKSHHCALCGDKGDVTELAALGHEFGEWTVIQNATCLAPSVEIRDCVRCDASENRVNLAPGHNKTQHAGKAPTCTDIGWEAYETCTKCDYSTYQNAVLKEKGHEYHKEVVQAKCEEQGYTEYTCVECGLSYKADYTEENGHTVSGWIIDKEAAVGTAGSRHTECTECGKVFTQESIPALPEPEKKGCSSVVWNKCVILTLLLGGCLTVLKKRKA